MIGGYFKESYVRVNQEDAEEYASPLVESVSRAFARDLGADALLAYAKAMRVVFVGMPISTWLPGQCQEALDAMWKNFADLFLEEMGIFEDNLEDWMAD
jgi:hypothetical protein